MPFCSNCAIRLDDNATSCYKCGKKFYDSTNGDSKQLLMRFKEGEFASLDKFLNDGWIIDDYKPTNDGQYIWTYVLLHKN